MNPTIRPTKVLDYYDGVLVFTAEGDDGQQYVGSIIDATDGIDRYLVKATTPERIKDLEKGRVDLRSLLLENPVNDWYLTFDGNAPDQPLELHPQSGSIETTDFLPSEGYFVDDQDAEAHERLIEKWLPINEVSIEAVREGGALAGHPPVNQLHVWWARRPLIASRAAVAASLLPIGADRSRFITNIGTTTGVVTARRQMDAVKAEGGWSDISFPNDRAFKHNPDFLPDGTTAAPLVLDVTAGGGSIPFEAGRLGFRTIANELNPVAPTSCVPLANGPSGTATLCWTNTAGSRASPTPGPALLAATSPASLIFWKASILKKPNRTGWYAGTSSTTMTFKKIESCARKDTFGRIFSRARLTVHPAGSRSPSLPTGGWTARALASG